MLTRKHRDRELFLLSNQELTDPANWPSLNQAFLKHFLLVLWWAESFLTKPNKELGRAGPVCPFASPSIERQLFWLTALAGSHPDPEELEETVLGYRDWFRDLTVSPAEDSQYKTILILLPEVTSDQFAPIIDATQRKLKPAFLPDQLMIGQFHSLCGEPGVHNPSFRPLRSPVPMLVIRYMTSADILFMKNESGEYNPEFLNIYLRTFGKAPEAT